MQATEKTKETVDVIPVIIFSGAKEADKLKLTQIITSLQKNFLIYNKISQSLRHM